MIRAVTQEMDPLGDIFEQDQEARPPSVEASIAATASTVRPRRSSLKSVSSTSWQARSAPSFQRKWTTELRAAVFSPNIFRAGAVPLFASFAFAAVLGLNTSFQLEGQGIDLGGTTWIIVREVPSIVSAATLGITSVLLSIASLRSVLIRHWENLMIFNVFMTFACFTCSAVMEDVRRGLHSPYRSHDHTNNTIVWSPGAVPIRYCEDPDVVETLSTRQVQDPGCLPELTSASTTFFICSCFMVAPYLHLSTRSAGILSLASIGWYVMALLATGSAGRASGPTALVLQAVISAITIFFCHMCRTNDEGELAYFKTINFAFEKASSLLRDLIPQEVLDKMRSGNAADPQIVCVPSSVVMFLSFELEICDVADMHLLAGLYSLFDAAVEEAGMHKQQHISCGSRHSYIVACPRVQRPYTADNLPETHFYEQMAVLAFELLGRVRSFEQRRGKIGGFQARVGMSAGVVAALILGVCRRFYCIYGECRNHGLSLGIGVRGVKGLEFG